MNKVIDVETKSEESMYVHQVDWDVIKEIIAKATVVNKLFTYTMPKKAESYAADGFNMLEEINKFGESEDESWRISLEVDVKISFENDKLIIGDWIVEKSLLNICIPTINSIIIIPSTESTYKGNKEYTKIIQLTNCISVTPLLIKLLDIPMEEDENKFKLGMNMEIITPIVNEEKTAE